MAGDLIARGISRNQNDEEYSLDMEESLFQNIVNAFLKQDGNHLRDKAAVRIPSNN